MTRPSRESAGAHPAQSAYGRSGWHAIPGSVRGERTLVGCGGVFRLGQLLVVSDGAQGVEHRRVGSLGAVREGARERMNENQGSVRSDREGVAPEAEREAERDRGHRDRIEGLARHVRADPRHPDDESIDRLVERGSPQGDAAEKRLGVSDRRCPRVRARRLHAAALAREEVPPQGVGEEREDRSQRRTRDARDLREIVRIAAKRAGQAREVEHE